MQVRSTAPHLAPHHLGYPALKRAEALNRLSVSNESNAINLSLEALDIDYRHAGPWIRLAAQCRLSSDEVLPKHLRGPRGSKCDREAGLSA